MAQTTAIAIVAPVESCPLFDISACEVLVADVVLIEVVDDEEDVSEPVI